MGSSPTPGTEDPAPALGLRRGHLPNATGLLPEQLPGDSPRSVFMERRAHIDAVAQVAGERERVTRGNLVGRDQAIEDNRRTVALDRAADTIARKVRRLGTATRRDAQQAMSSAHRALVSIDEVLDHAVGLGLIIETDDGYGPSRRSA